MVHKKYIKRGNKVFGPYFYENYRENGITKTRYLGTALENSADSKQKKFSFNFFKKIKKIMNPHSSKSSFDFLDAPKLKPSPKGGRIISDIRKIKLPQFPELRGNFSFLLLAVVVMLGLFSYSFFSGGLTGRAIFDFSSSSNLNLETPASYNLGDLVYGNVSLKLKNGELIPADSVVRFSLNKQQKDVLISDLISAQSANG
ncbi:MAG: hypothetical protein Q7S33_05525, partial [Nanoarchaeota archaeon]|nr:hypothetical protein [Nanoarchaeota archaeon]